MGVQYLPGATLHPRLLADRDPALNTERRRIADRRRGGARELFAFLAPMVLASRPRIVVDEGTPRERVVLGRATFRNVLGEIR
ncbi:MULTISPECIES: hypothetical protein [unclassified Microbacterium]|uniref:hypothetical protein n=1 Tax=unclassified Microbacterium TaxID=2609290 RepID=UPI0034441FEA